MIRPPGAGADTHPDRNYAPAIYGSLLVTGMRTGAVYRLKLNEDGSAVSGPPLQYFKRANRYRDTAVSADGRRIFVVTDSFGTTSDARGERTEALAEPVRIVRNLNKINAYTDTDETPYAFIECVQTIFPLEGHAVQASPGSTIDYEIPDMYGRPWAAIWEKYFEQGMSKPKGEDLFNFE